MFPPVTVNNDESPAEHVAIAFVSPVKQPNGFVVVVLVVEEEEVVEIQEDDGEVKKENLEILIKILEEGSNPQVVHDKALLLFGQEYLSGVEAVAESVNITLEKVLTLLSKPVVMYALKRMQPKTEGEL